MRLTLWLLVMAMSSASTVRAADDDLEEACFTAIGGDKLSTDVIVRSDQKGQVVTLRVVSRDQTTTYECEFVGDASVPRLVRLVMISDDGVSTKLPIDEPNRRISERYAQ